MNIWFNNITNGQQSNLCIESITGMLCYVITSDAFVLVLTNKRNFFICKAQKHLGLTES